MDCIAELENMQKQAAARPDETEEFFDASIVAAAKNLQEKKTDVLATQKKLNADMRRIARLNEDIGDSEISHNLQEYQALLSVPAQMTDVQKWLGSLDPSDFVGPRNIAFQRVREEFALRANFGNVSGAMHRAHESAVQRIADLVRFATAQKVDLFKKKQPQAMPAVMGSMEQSAREQARNENRYQVLTNLPTRE